MSEVSAATRASASQRAEKAPERASKEVEQTQWVATQRGQRTVTQSDGRRPRSCGLQRK